MCLERHPHCLPHSNAHPSLQVIEHHSAFLRRVLKGCLLTRQVRLLRTLLELKLLATKFSEGSIERLRVDFESIDQEVWEDPSECLAVL